MEVTDHETGLTAGPVVGPPPPGQVTLVDGVTFMLSDLSGDVDSGHEQGLFHRDTRFLSRWHLEVDGYRLSPLTCQRSMPHSATFVTRRPPAPHLADSTLVVTRRRQVGDGMVEDICVANYGREAAAVDLRLVVDSDFAGLFEVKEGRVRARPAIRVDSAGNRLTLRHVAGEQVRALTVEADCGARAIGNELRWQLFVGAHEHQSVRVRVTLGIDDAEVAPRLPAEGAHRVAAPDARFAAWRAATPVISSGDPTLAHTLARSMDSLGALRIFHPDDPERTVIAAGAPWFMTLFGRDSLLTGWMMLPLDPMLALGTVRTLAELQGREVNPISEEQPGRILHEVRSGPAGEFVLGEGNAYYGSVDATPLFVMLVGELYRWGVPPARLDDLLPNVWAALDWMARFGDADGDGFLEYRRATTRGLRNQGWKDSFDGVNYRNGTLAEPPIALAEVQGYAYAAWLTGAQLAERIGERTRAAGYRARAAALRRAFAEQFWLPEHGHLAAALDGDKRPVDALVSNIGHCLWTGIVEPAHAGATAATLLTPRLFSGHGIRTLATDMGAYNPVSYHNGSVWPHDTAIAVSGLIRYGFLAEAHRVALGLLAAAGRLGGVLPELFCGFARTEFPDPVPFPTSCHPQAWAAAAPLLLMRALLRFDPDLPAGVVHCAPALPEGLLPLSLANLQLAGRPLALEVTDEGWELTGLSADIRLARSPAPLPG
jgi:glycogen debranching enzyme